MQILLRVVTIETPIMCGLTLYQLLMEVKVQFKRKPHTFLSYNHELHFKYYSNIQIL